MALTKMATRPLRATFRMAGKASLPGQPPLRQAQDRLYEPEWLFDPELLCEPDFFPASASLIVDRVGATNAASPSKPSLLSAFRLVSVSRELFISNPFSFCCMAPAACQSIVLVPETGIHPNSGKNVRNAKLAR